MKRAEDVLGDKNGLVRLRVHVRPRAARNAIRFDRDGRVCVAVTATAAKGAANKALCALVADFFGIGKRSVTIRRGERSREKVLALEGISVEDVRGRLQTFEGGHDKQ